MKRRNKYKNYISLVLVLIVLTVNIVPKSYAVGGILPQRVAAMIASGITAINIGLSALTIPGQAFATEQIIDPLHLYTTEAESDYQEYLDKSLIKIDRGVTVIDGVSYDNVWLSHDAADKFRTEAFDFATAYEIASEESGTYADGAGYVAGNPVYKQDGSATSISPEYTFRSTGTFETGDVSTIITKNPNDRYYSVKTVWADGTTTDNTYIASSPSFGRQFALSPAGRGQTRAENSPGSWSSWSTPAASRLPVDNTPFQFDYTAGVIPVDPLPVDYGINYRVPSTVINNVYNNYYGDDETDWPDLSIPVEMDVDTTDGALLAVMIADLIADTIDALKSDTNITINYAPQPDIPIPPEPDVPQPAPDVDPDTPASEITYNDYYQTITNQTTYMTESIDNIDNSIQNVIENQDQIIENQDTIINDSIPEIIENIPKIDEICNNIDTAPYHDLDTGLDHLPTIFLPFITDLRSALGIWHYVTEWLGQISTTFSFVTGCLVGTSIMTPIYAAIAGFMCIKVYRRMTG